MNKDTSSFDKKSNGNRFFKNPKVIVILALAISIIVILAIVLPVTLTNRKKITLLKKHCPDGISTPKINCLSDLEEVGDLKVLENTCQTRGCCWAPDSSTAPDCSFADNLGYTNNKWREKSYSKMWLDLIKLSSETSISKSDISNLEAKIEMQSDERIHIKIYPRRNFKNKVQRWEIPSGIKNENINKPLYKIEIIENPFYIRVARTDTNQIIFDTSKSSLIFSDQFLQITTSLSSDSLFGIGEHSKPNLKHDLNYKTWPIFASQNHPHNAEEKPNLYSQFPMYLNIEPDGNSHLVVFYNSNPSEIYLTPFPSLTYRAIGGIFDIYIFMGPSPIQAIEQFQQTFGLPKLPPYWSLGLQIGSKNYNSTVELKNFVNKFKNYSLPFDSVLIDTEYMSDSGMFTLNNNFENLISFTDDMRNESRATIAKFTPGILNDSLSYPFDKGTFKDKIWIMENFFSVPVVGKLLGRNVVYPDFTMEKTADWWKSALKKFILENLKVDGIFLDYLSPYNENPSVCQNNKWNSPIYKPAYMRGEIYNETICMDSRHSNSKHYNIHGIYSHYMISATAKALESIITNRTFLMSRHGFIGSGEYTSKYLGEYNSDWKNLKHSVVSMMEMAMFGFPMSGGDMCGSQGNFDKELCMNWIKISGMSPMMKLSIENIADVRMQNLMSKELFSVLNATLYLRYSLLPYFYTQLYHATLRGTMVIRPLAFQFPTDKKSFEYDNQWLWGDKLMVTGRVQASSSDGVYFPQGVWYNYHTGFKSSSNANEGTFAGNIQSNPNMTVLHIKGGSVILTQECKLTATESHMSFVDIIIALDENYTAIGDFYVDDGYRRNAARKENYHRLTQFKVYKKDDNGIIEIKRKNGKYATKLSYRNLVIYGLNSRPLKVSVNENSTPIDSSKTNWETDTKVYRVNLQTEILKKVIVDNEYLSLKWFGGYKNEN